MRWVPGRAEAVRQEVSMADPMAQTVALTGPTPLKVAQKAAPMARARRETAAERKAGSEAN
jgi:hypothetical protein